ncbi:hypothetical protein PV375_01175 [Gulosibacter sp. GYB002]|uniref:hypothetical protein n=1 Tax=Gulosibacter sp. GYB002 TaxID=2994391 RepID=UPI002F96AA5B
MAQFNYGNVTPKQVKVKSSSGRIIEVPEQIVETFGYELVGESKPTAAPTKKEAK